MIAIVVILAVSTLFSISWFRVTYPRNLHVGDRFTYKVVFPDSNGYTLTEIVEKKLRINNIDVYVIFRDDDQHISTSYLWLTINWHEIRSFKPYIGNLNASSTVIYEPPIELVHIPLRVGDKWEINSSVTTRTSMDNIEQVAVSIFRENRETVSLELVRTPIGNFQAYKITVESSNSPFETIWFSGELGQIVYAEFYNPIGEMVTETLTGFVLNATVDTLASPGAILAGLSTSANLAGNLSEVICTTNPAVSVELKIPYD